jgi:predicted transcriptional regulator
MIVTKSKLKRLRNEAGLTQRELAKLAGVSQAHIAKIERGRVDPRLSTVNKILRVLTTGKGKKCGNIMTDKVISAKSDDEILKVSKLMMRHAISQVPVMRDGKCIGTVTEESIIRNLSSTIAEEPVRKVMQPQLPGVPEDTDISLVKPLLEDHPGVLVIRRGEVVGIITRSDLLKIVS